MFTARFAKKCSTLSLAIRKNLALENTVPNLAKLLAKEGACTLTATSAEIKYGKPQRLLVFPKAKNTFVQNLAKLNGVMYYFRVRNIPFGGEVSILIIK